MRNISYLAFPVPGKDNTAVFGTGTENKNCMSDVHTEEWPLVCVAPKGQPSPSPVSLAVLYSRLQAHVDISDSVQRACAFFHVRSTRHWDRKRLDCF